MKRAKRKLTNKETEPTKKTAKEKTALVVPDDVFFEILGRLPARSVGRFRCVSKSWLSITTHWTFVRAHTQHSRATRQSIVLERSVLRERIHFASAIAPTGITLYKLNGPTRSSIRATCDGLLCLWGQAIRKHSIFNPLTRSSVILPANTRLHTCLLAFYFHHSTSEYRLLAAAQDEITSMEVGTSMLAVGQNSWKDISCRLPAFCNHSYTADLNGSLHWLAWKQKTLLYTSPPDIIMTFDKEAEAYGLLSLPPLAKLHDGGSNLVNFKGELGLWVADNFGIDLWVMEECWVKKYSVNYVDTRGSLTVLDVLPTLTCLIGVAVSIGDEELLIDINYSGTLYYLVRCNLISGACVVRYWKINSPCLITPFPYMKSLADPNPSFLSKNYVQAASI